MKKYTKFLFRGSIRNKNKSLLELDDLYKNVIITFPEKERKDYCNRLIARLKYELQNDSGLDKKRKADMKTIIKAAEIELKD